MKKAQFDKAVKEGAEALKGLKMAFNQQGFWSILRAVISSIPEVVLHVEQASKALGIKGADKKELALDIIMLLLEPVLPWWARWIPVREILGAAIDAIVHALNSYAKKWKAKK